MQKAVFYILVITQEHSAKKEKYCQRITVNTYKTYCFTFQKIYDKHQELLAVSSNTVIKEIMVATLLVHRETRSSADAHNRLDTFSGQSRSTNIIPFHVTYSFLLCNSNLSLRRAMFTIFDIKKCCDLEMWVKGHSRSLRVISFDRLCMVSY